MINQAEEAVGFLRFLRSRGIVVTFFPDFENFVIIL